MRNARLIVLTAVFVFFVATFLVVKSQVQKPESDKRKDATRVTEGVLSAKQIEHSRLYTQISRRKKLNTAKDGTTMVIGLPWLDERTKNKRDFAEYLRELTCKADTVVFGTVRSKASQLTPDATFIFTDYEFVVTEALKNNPSSYIESNSEITITRPGGSINLEERLISVKDKSFKPLEAHNVYLLFLTYIPSTGAYRSLDSESSFEISGNKLLQLTEEQPTYKATTQLNDASAINAIRRFANNCDNPGVGK